MGYPVGYSSYNEYSVFPGAQNAPPQGGAAPSPFPPGVMPVTVPGMGAAQPAAAAAPPPEEKKGFFSKLGSAVKGFVKGATVGLVKTVVDVVTDPKKLLLTAAAIGACFIPGVGPVIAAGLMTYGLAQAGKGIAQGAAVAAEGWKTNNTDLIESGFSDIGTSGAVGALTVAGMRGAVAARGVTPKGTGFKQMNSAAWKDGKAYVNQVRAQSSYGNGGLVAEASVAGRGMVQNLNTNVVQPFKAARTQTADDVAAQTADDVAAQVGDDVAAQVTDDVAGATTTTTGTSTTGGVVNWAQNRWNSFRNRDNGNNPTTQVADDAASGSSQQLALLDEAGNINPGVLSTPKVPLTSAEAARLQQLQQIGSNGRLPYQEAELASLLAKQEGTVTATTGTTTTAGTTSTTPSAASSNPFQFKVPNVQNVRQGTTDFFNGVHNVYGSINKSQPGLLYTVPAFSGPYSEVEQLIQQQQAMYAQQGGHV